MSGRVIRVRYKNAIQADFGRFVIPINDVFETDILYKIMSKKSIPLCRLKKIKKGIDKNWIKCYNIGIVKKMFALLIYVNYSKGIDKTKLICYNICVVKKIYLIKTYGGKIKRDIDKSKQKCYNICVSSK